MKKQVKAILIVIIAVAAAIGYYLYDSMPMEVEALAVSSGNVSMYFTHQGQGVKGNAVAVYPLVSGEILSVEVNEGDYVKKGDVICIADSSDFERALLRSETTIKAYEAQKQDLGLSETREKNSLSANRADLQAQLEALRARSESKNISSQEQISLQESVNNQLEANLDWAKNNFERAEKLYEVDAVSKQEFDDANKLLQDSEKALEQGNMQIAAIASGTDSSIGSDEYFGAMEASILAQIAGIDKNLGNSYTAALGDYYTALTEGENVNIAQIRKQIEDCTIKAPISGKIDKLPINDSNILTAAAPVAYISADANVDIEVYVLTKDITNISLGDNADIIFKTRDEDINIPAVVSAIDDKAEEKLSALGVMEKKVKVTLETQPNEIIKDGYDVDVKFTYYSEENKISIPKTAVFSHENKDWVWLLKGDTATMANITKGIELRGETVVESGLTDGDIIIKDANSNKIKEGSKIAPLK